MSLQKIKGYAHWKKATLRDYVRKNNIPYNQNVYLTRKVYMDAIRAYEDQFKNITRKSVNELKDLVDKYNIQVTPTGQRGRILRKDLIAAIKEVRQPEQIVEREFRAVRRHQDNYRSFILIPKLYNNDLINFFDTHKEQIVNKIKSQLRELGGIKVQLAVKVRYVKTIPEEKEIEVHHTSKQKVVLNNTQIREAVNECIAEIYKNDDRFTNEGSGWILDKILEFYINISKYNPTSGSSYIDLPQYLKAKNAIINVKNEDNECLRWTLRAALEIFKPQIQNQIDNNPKYKLHRERTFNYAKEDGLKFKGIDFPTPIEQISKVEKQNNLSINVFIYNNGEIQPRHISKDFTLKPIDLLLYTEGDNSHYCWIKNFNRLLHDTNNHQHRKYFCRRCLYHFKTKDKLDDHLEDCAGMDAPISKVIFPQARPGEKYPILKFKNHKNKQKAPFVIYADFEAILKKLPESTESDRVASKATRNINVHKASGYSIAVIRCDGELVYQKTYRGKDANTRFVQEILALKHNINLEFANPMPIRMTKEDEIRHQNANVCWICDKAIYPNYPSNCQCAEPEEPTTQKQKEEYTYTNDKGYTENKCLTCKKKINKFRKVRDHCHTTGVYRGAAHAYCNLKLQVKPNVTQIPVFFHNLENYDAHLIMQAISEYKDKKEIFVIPKNSEKYISFSVGNLVFKDSLNFLLSSLDRLVKACPPEAFDLLKDQFKDKPADLLLKKGVYPYEYMDDFDKFKETSLPPKEEFYSKLKDEHITDDDYARAQRVWDEFDIRDMGEYHDLYMRTDTLLLTCVYENFRKVCLTNYKLDPANYYTAPGLSWDALLYHSNIELELLTDIDKHLFFEKAKRGGISSVGSARHARANNPMLENYNPDESTSYIGYLDANNLYGWAMSQPLPYADFKWHKHPENLTVEDIEELDPNAERGCFLEVDLDYPEHLHDYHNDYPLAPENITIPDNWLSDYQNDLLETELNSNVAKLTCTLNPKKKYVLHYRTLQLYLKLGLKLTKIHRLLTFKQSCWMKSYIDKNTQLRTKGKSDFEKDFFKLMNNSVFGKTMENVRKRIDGYLLRDIEDADKYQKLVKSPSYKNTTAFEECNLSFVEMYKTKTILNKPIYCGVSVLDLSKTLMYDFYYNDLKAKYADKIELLYTDTDSLLFKVETQDLYEDIYANKDNYDLSNFDPESKYFDPKNKKVIGKFKDEMGGKAIKEVVCIRSKMYSILTGEEQCIKKAKGVSKVVTKKELKHSNYLNCVYNKKASTHTMTSIRTNNHITNTIEQDKTSLSPLDTKRYVLPDGITTLAFGHRLLG